MTRLKTRKIAIMVLTAAALATSPASEMAPYVKELVNAVQVQAAEITVTAKHSTKKYPVIKKTGTYNVEASDEDDKVFAFQAPKDGTYVFKFKDLRGKGETVEESFCYAGIAVGKGKPVDYHDGNGIWVDAYPDLVYWSGYLGGHGKPVEYIPLASPRYAEEYASHYTDAKSMKEYYAMPGEYQKTGKVKVKLKKGQKLYFKMNYSCMHASQYDTGVSGVVTLDITMK